MPQIFDYPLAPIASTTIRTREAGKHTASLGSVRTKSKFDIRGSKYQTVAGTMAPPTPMGGY